ncbi:MAG: hypothetical protein Sylvanvirus5_15 [Sylvanvirus sp.]|uniref:SAP domain-containing protein n=1 Tax=Sylvanvirus sp. TaxID=2487774 RepID=A0A3G5AHH5_9VIRU|nr:MAG: hypothetical protein Sylvanvirus5_15 [Sylvanvirus sp.]
MSSPTSTSTPSNIEKDFIEYGDIDSMFTQKMLIEECKRLNLRTGGLKAEVQQRLHDYYLSIHGEPAPSTNFVPLSKESAEISYFGSVDAASEFLANSSISELRSICKSWKVSYTGTRKQLEDRLQETYALYREYLAYKHQKSSSPEAPITEVKASTSTSPSLSVPSVADESTFLASLTLAELRSTCSEWHLSTAGSRQQIEERLHDHYKLYREYLESKKKTHQEKSASPVQPARPVSPQTTAAVPISQALRTLQLSEPNTTPTSDTHSAIKCVESNLKQVVLNQPKHHGLCRQKTFCGFNKESPNMSDGIVVENFTNQQIYVALVTDENSKIHIKQDMQLGASASGAKVGLSRAYEFAKHDSVSKASISKRLDNEQKPEYRLQMAFSVGECARLTLAIASCIDRDPKRPCFVIFRKDESIPKGRRFNVTQQMLEGVVSTVSGADWGAV